MANSYIDLPYFRTGAFVITHTITRESIRRRLRWLPYCRFRELRRAL